MKYGTTIHAHVRVGLVKRRAYTLTFGFVFGCLGFAFCWLVGLLMMRAPHSVASRRALATAAKAEKAVVAKAESQAISKAQSYF